MYKRRKKSNIKSLKMALAQYSLGNFLKALGLHARPCIGNIHKATEMASCFFLWMSCLRKSGDVWFNLCVYRLKVFKMFKNAKTLNPFQKAALKCRVIYSAHTLHFWLSISAKIQLVQWHDCPAPRVCRMKAEHCRSESCLMIYKPHTRTCIQTLRTHTDSHTDSTLLITVRSVYRLETGL